MRDEAGAESGCGLGIVTPGTHTVWGHLALLGSLCMHPVMGTSFSRVMVEVEVRKCRLLVSRGAAPSKNKCQL